MVCKNIRSHSTPKQLNIFEGTQCEQAIYLEKQAVHVGLRTREKII